MQTQYDLSIRNGNGEEVIAMEYKLHRDPLSVNDLTLIFDKIYANSTCRIGFIVAVNFAPALKKEQDWKDLSPTCIIDQKQGYFTPEIHKITPVLPKVAHGDAAVTPEMHTVTP